MSNFTLFKRGNPCPLCDSNSGKCKENAEELILCRTLQDEIDTPPGYKFVGRTKDGGWGMWAIDDRNSTEFDREQWKQELARKREQRARDEAERRAQAMPGVERNRYYRQLSSQLSLSADGRADLQRRGLSDEEIKRSGIKSVGQWQPLARELPHDLPGVNLDGLSLNTQPGDLYPIYDVDGLLVGCQIRLRDPEDGGRYRWLTSATKRRPNGPTSHLPNGELPLAVHRPIEVRRKAIALTEGVGPKPFITSQRLGVVTIGAAGGQFAGSPQTLKYTLDKLSEELGSKTVEFYPDAGAISNEGVLRQYRAVWKLLRQWGYSVQIAWWGQISKPFGDIDELEELSRIEFISVARFESIAHSSPKEFGRWLRQNCSKATWRFWKRFGKLPQNPQYVQEPASETECTEIVLYDRNQSGRWTLKVTAETVPTPEEWAEMGRPRLEYEPTDQLEVWKRIIELQYPTVLVDGVVGGGKSKTAGELLEWWQSTQQEKAVYYATDYRNPSTASLESLPESPTGGALVFDYEHLTPSGKPHRKRPKAGEKPSIQPLCIEDGNIQALRAKGLDVYRGYDEATGEASPICSNCEHYAGRWKDCPFLKAQAQYKQEIASRSHLSKGGSGQVAVVDEASRAIGGDRQIEVRILDLEVEVGRLATLSPELYNLLHPIVERVVNALRRATDERGFYGLSHAELMPQMPSRRELEELLWQQVADLWLKTDDVWTLNGSLEHYASLIQRVIQPAIDEAFTGISSAEGKATVISDIFTAGILPRLLRLISGRSGDISITNEGNIRFTSRSNRDTATLRKFQTRILLDATPDLLAISRKLGIHSREILRVGLPKPKFNNLTIKIVNGIGKAGAQRERYQDGKQIESQYSQQSRIEKLVQTLIDRDDSKLRGLLDLKRYIDRYEEMPLLRGYNFVHNRGSNAFEGVDELILIAPNSLENLGSLISEWHVLTGQALPADTQDPRFWGWAQAKARAELIQGNGRSRAQRRPETPVTHWLIGELSDADINALRGYFPGATVETVDVYNICPAAASRGVQTERGMFEAMWAAAQSGAKATIDTIAEQVGVTKGRISQILREIGGFRVVQKSLVLLYGALNSETKLSELPDDLRWIAQSYLPSVLMDLGQNESSDGLQEFISVWASLGEATFRKVLSACSAYVLTGFIKHFAGLLPNEAAEEMRSCRLQEAIA